MKKKLFLAAFILMAVIPLSVGESPRNSIVVNTTDTSDDRGREISPRPNCGPDLGGCSASL